MADGTRRCVVTGATGYVGGRIAAHLRSAGWDVSAWSRNPGEGGVRFRLGDDIDVRSFDGATALVHCAYDFGPIRFDDVQRINVQGSAKLLRAARSAGVEQIVFISSASAFDGCRSLYGRSKLEIERVAQSIGGTVVRPGLVYGDHPGGVFGGLVEQVTHSRVIPLLGGGRHFQYLVHDADLAAFVQSLVSGDVTASVPVYVAHEQPWTLRQLLEHIAATVGRRPVFISVPWRAVWFGLKTLETFRIQAPFRSDSVLGLVHQDPRPSTAVAISLGIECRPFAITRETLVGPD